MKDWVDDMKKWPQVEKPQILCYLVKSKACDLKDANAFRSMQSFTYMQSGWVGALFVHEIDEALVLLKGEVRASQALATYHNVWVCCERSGTVISGGCTCMAGQGKVCSHVGALLWKVDLAVLSGFTGEGCTDKTAGWNKGTKRNLEPAALEDINFKMAEGTIDEDAPRKMLHSLPRFCGNDEELTEFYKDCPFQEILRHPGSLFHATMTAPPRQPQQRADAVPAALHEDTNGLPGRSHRLPATAVLHCSSPLRWPLNFPISSLCHGVVGLLLDPSLGIHSVTPVVHWLCWCISLHG